MLRRDRRGVAPSASRRHTWNPDRAMSVGVAQVWGPSTANTKGCESQSCNGAMPAAMPDSSTAPVHHTSLYALGTLAHRHPLPSQITLPPGLFALCGHQLSCVPPPPVSSSVLLCLCSLT